MGIREQDPREESAFSRALHKELLYSWSVLPCLIQLLSLEEPTAFTSLVLYLLVWLCCHFKAAVHLWADEAISGRVFNLWLPCFPQPWRSRHGACGKFDVCVRKTFSWLLLALECTRSSLWLFRCLTKDIFIFNDNGGRAKSPGLVSRQRKQERKKGEKTLTFISDSLSLSLSVPVHDVSVLGNWLIPDDPQIHRTWLNIKGDQIMRKTSRLQSVFLDLFNFHF